jgi:hypothetical protein
LLIFFIQNYFKELNIVKIKMFRLLFLLSLLGACYSRVLRDYNTLPPIEDLLGAEPSLFEPVNEPVNTPRYMFDKNKLPKIEPRKPAPPTYTIVEIEI